MAGDGDRTRYFPAIESRHGGPISLWLDRLAELDDQSYRRQFDYLREEHGFSREHANALVMYARGSTSSKRFATPDAWFAATVPTAAATARRIFAAVVEHRPDLELVVAWNHPMLRTADGGYVIGVSVAKDHVLINPFSAAVLERFAQRLPGRQRNKKTFAVPLDWHVDEPLLHDITDARLRELAGPTDTST